MTLLPKAELVLGSASDTLVRTGVGLGKPLAIKSLGCGLQSENVCSSMQPRRVWTGFQAS